MDLTVTKREIFGKGVNLLRNAGIVPAELYGHGSENSHLSVSAKEFAKVFKAAGETTVVTLLLDKAKVPAIIYHIQKDSISGEVSHIDFYQVRMDEVMSAKIPVEFVGESPAVREQGAVVNKVVSELEVEALPQDLPHQFVVDLSSLTEIGKTIYVRDIAVPKGVKMLVEEDMAVVSAVAPAAEEVVEAPVADVTDVKVETEEKKAERDEKKGAEEDK